MNSPDAKFGFRVLGGVGEPLRLVVAADAFAAHCAADPRAETGRECYLSAFRFGEDFRARLTAGGTPKGYVGPTWSPWVWFDIDRTTVGDALTDARSLAGSILERYRRLDEDDLLLFFSGGKGFHVGLPLPHHPPPSPLFHDACRKLAMGLAANAGVNVDTAVYDRVRLFRAPNSRHPKSGAFKRWLTHEELFGLSGDRIRTLAAEPLAFDVPYPAAADDTLAADWAEAVSGVTAKRTEPSPPGGSTGRPGSSSEPGPRRADAT